MISERVNVPYLDSLSLPFKVAPAEDGLTENRLFVTDKQAVSWSPGDTFLFKGAVLPFPVKLEDGGIGYKSQYPVHSDPSKYPALEVLALESRIVFSDPASLLARNCYSAANQLTHHKFWDFREEYAHLADSARNILKPHLDVSAGSLNEDGVILADLDESDALAWDDTIILYGAFAVSRATREGRPFDWVDFSDKLESFMDLARRQMRRLDERVLAKGYIGVPELRYFDPERIPGVKAGQAARDGNLVLACLAPTAEAEAHPFYLNPETCLVVESRYDGDPLPYNLGMAVNGLSKSMIKNTGPGYRFPAGEPEKRDIIEKLIDADGNVRFAYTESLWDGFEDDLNRVLEEIKHGKAESVKPAANLEIE